VQIIVVDIAFACEDPKEVNYIFEVFFFFFFFFGGNGVFKEPL
jgi:hypothetical protein